jgi:hypothetical protein
VRLFEVSGVFQIGNYVADCGGGEAFAGELGDRARPDRLAGGDVGLDQKREHLAASFVNHDGLVWHRI